MSVSTVMKIVKREVWGALPGKPLEPMELPAKYVLFSAENKFHHCLGEEECAQTVRDIQKYYLDQGLEDIPYHFIIGNDGRVYEGRGWGYKPCADVQKDPMYKENPTVDIAVICGHYDIIREKMDLVRESFQMAEDFVKYGIQEQKIIKEYDFEGFTDDVVDPTEPTEQEIMDAQFEEFALQHPEEFPIMHKQILAKRAKLADQTLPAQPAA